MINITQKTLPDGTIAIKIGRVTAKLRTSGEVEAFMTGVKIAHLALAKAIEPILAVKP